MDEATKYLLGQGVLGIVVVYLAWLLREARADIKAERAEIKALTERYEAKFEKVNDKSQLLAAEVTNAFETAIRNSSEGGQRRRRNTLAKVPNDE